MSATHKPNSVAMATADGCGTCPSLAVKDPTGDTQRWFVWGHGIVHEGLLTSIARCVVLEGVTRADADALDRCEPFESDKPLLTRIAAAIREQTPEPKPEPRWTVRDNSASTTLLDGRRSVGIFAERADAVRAADALNAADKEHSDD